MRAAWSRPELPQKATSANEGQTNGGHSLPEQLGAADPVISRAMIVSTSLNRTGTPLGPGALLFSSSTVLPCGLGRHEAGVKKR
jgi:hypothetical protein